MRSWLPFLLCVVGCGSRTFAPCDIRDADCQQTLLNALAERRGETQVAPAVALRTPDEVLADEVATATDDERIAFARQNSILALFELTQPGLTLEDREQIRVDDLSAFYSSSSKTVTIVDRGTALDDASTTLTFVHELVHAMQDGDGFLDLAFANVTTTDRIMARRAVVEGEATLYQVVAALDMYGWHPSDRRVQAALTEITSGHHTFGYGSGSLLYDNTTRFVYPYGHAYLRPRYDRDGQVGIASVYFNLPDTAFEIIVGAAPTPRLGDQAIASRGPDDTTVIADSFGVYNVRDWCLGQPFAAFWCDQMLDDAFTGIMPADGSPLIGVWRLRSAEAFAQRDVDDLRYAGYGAAIIDGDLVIARDAIGRALDPTSFVTGWRAIGD